MALNSKSILVADDEMKKFLCWKLASMMNVRGLVIKIFKKEWENIPWLSLKSSQQPSHTINGKSESGTCLTSDWMNCIDTKLFNYQLWHSLASIHHHTHLLTFWYISRIQISLSREVNAFKVKLNTFHLCLKIKLSKQRNGKWKLNANWANEWIRNMCKYATQKPAFLQVCSLKLGGFWTESRPSEKWVESEKILWS